MPSEREPVIHDLKIWPRYFDAVANGSKRFEFRQDDRGGFWPGDVLRLREWCPERQDYTGRETRQRITYVMELVEYLGGHAILSIEPEDRAEAERALSTARDELAHEKRRWSVTFGDLPEAIRASGLIESHAWDNKNISEQRDWAVAALALSRAEVERLTDVNAKLLREQADWSDRFHDKKERAEAAESELAQARAEIERLRVRAVTAEHHKALELLSKGSAVEQLEMRLREQLANAELRAEAADASLADLQAQVEGLPIIDSDGEDLIGLHDVLALLASLSAIGQETGHD